MGMVVKFKLCVLQVYRIINSLNEAFNKIFSVIWSIVAHTAPGDQKMMEAVILKGKSGISCSDLETKGVQPREECAVQGSVGHKEGWALWCLWLIGLLIMVIEGGRSGLLGLTGSLPVFGDSLHPVVKYYGTPSFPFMFFCFFPS